MHHEGVIHLALMDTRSGRTKLSDILVDKFAYWIVMVRLELDLAHDLFEALETNFAS